MTFRLILFALAFLLGSIPFGLLVARAFVGGDIRAQGSGNIGATNVARVAGFWPAGVLTFLLDVLKGMAVPMILSFPMIQTGWLATTSGGMEINSELEWLAGLCAVLGHCFSPWVKFKGGKGVATGFGVILVMTPAAAVCGALAFAFAFFKTRVGSLSSITGLLVAFVAHLVIHDHSSYGPDLLIFAVMAFLILIRHEANLDRLLKGKERSF